jgi:hypothetical protein
VAGSALQLINHCCFGRIMLFFFYE